jgi:hypothetical protein
MSDKPRLFISYARNDDEPFVKRLHGDLTRAGFDVWWDRVSMPNRGLAFTKEIADAIAAAERVLLICGPAALKSDYVTREWTFALEEACKVITPVVRICDFADVPNSSGFSMPSILRMTRPTTRRSSACSSSCATRRRRWRI